ncbi:MAG: dihydrolipoyl dehydrogenase [Methylobacter sp.]|nr:MAG: dihydrolipoyl dehydrogenase [Methylobacter sp.]
MTTPINEFDAVIVGAGPAGYAAAIRCAQLGLNTACVDKYSGPAHESELGGTNAHGGSLATLALLESAKFYQALIFEYHNHGIMAENIYIDPKRMMLRKNAIIDHYQKNLSNIFNVYNIRRFHATARLLSERQLQLSPINGGETEIIRAQHIILATGASGIPLPNVPLDNEHIISYPQALNIEQIPKHLCIIGAGVIGLELAAIWSRLGAKTTILEAQQQFLAKADQQIAREAYRIYTEQGIDLCLGARVIAVKKIDKKVQVEFRDQEGIHALITDKVIVASGRKPNTENLATPETNLLLDESGFVHVDGNCRTNLPGVYAIGDLTAPGPMFAHKGIAEGVFVAEQIAGNQPAGINYNLIPSIIYSDPEIAWAGQTEQELIAMGEPFKTGIFPFSSNLRSQTEQHNKGFVKIIAHAEHDTILGVHIIGSQASELISEALVAMEFSASSEDLGKTIHVHPSRSEALQEAALTVTNRSLHWFSLPD